LSTAEIKKPFIFFLGIAIFSITIGFSTGVSLSPVLGTVFSLIFPIITIVLTQFKKDENKTITRNIDLKLIGQILLTFSFCFIVGSFLGYWVRTFIDQKSIYSVLVNGFFVDKSEAKRLLNEIFSAKEDIKKFIFETNNSSSVFMSR
jgi:hypothetical protein